MKHVANDLELWERIRSANDQRAFAALYHRHAKRLYGFAYNKLRDVQQCEDLVQEAFANLWKKRSETIAITDMKGFLTIAIRYLTINAMKKNRDSLLQPFTTDAQEPIDPLNPQHFYDVRYLATLLAEEKERLPAQCRLVFQYSREQGYKIPEIAAMMQLSPKTVEAHLTTALKRLRKILLLLLLLRLLGL